MEWVSKNLQPAPDIPENFVNQLMDYLENVIGIDDPDDITLKHVKMGLKSLKFGSKERTFAESLENIYFLVKKRLQTGWKPFEE